MIDQCVETHRHGPDALRIKQTRNSDLVRVHMLGRSDGDIVLLTLMVAERLHVGIALHVERK